MSEAVEEYAREYAREYAQDCVDEQLLKNVKSLMKSMHITLEQAINALGISGNSKDYILSQMK